MRLRSRFSLALQSAIVSLAFAGMAPAGSSSPADPAVPPAVAEDLPEEIERQIEEQTEQLPDEVREKVRERIKEAARKKIEELKAAKAGEGGESEKGDGEPKAAEGGDAGKPNEAAKPEEKKPEPNPQSEESKKLNAEMELEATRFKHAVAMYEKELANQRLMVEKSKIDRQLEAARAGEQLASLQRDLDRLKLEVTLEKTKAEAEQARLDAKLAIARAEKARIEQELATEDAREKLEDRVLGEEAYPDEPFADGVLRISLRRIELNGPIYEGAADYICQRLDYFNNQSGKPIFLVIDNSPGGSVMEGFQIVQAIKRSKAPVHVVVKRFAASMAACITTLADHSYCYPNAIILHHQASSGLSGNGREIRDQVNQFNEISHRLIGDVAKKIGKGEQEFVDEMYKNRVSGDWELFGDQAVEAGWVEHLATTIREDGIRTRPTGVRSQPQRLLILGESAISSQPAGSGYLERYEVLLPEERDEQGKRFVRLPRLAPVDAWLLYNPDGYYRN